MQSIDIVNSPAGNDAIDAGVRATVAGAAAWAAARGGGSTARTRTAALLISFGRRLARRLDEVKAEHALCRVVRAWV